MKWLFYLAGVLAVASSLPAPAQAQTASPQTPAATNNAHAEAIELLRKVIAEQQQNPGRIIRTPTNPVARPKIAATNAPAGAVSSGTNRPNVATTAPLVRTSRAELEKQFLDGKITAKQYQRAILELEKNPPPPVAPAASSPAATATARPPEQKPIAGSPVPVTRKPASPEKTVGAPTPAPQPPAPRTASTPPNANVPPSAAAQRSTAVDDDEAVEQKALTDVEAKIDEILARRAALQEAARTNSAASTNAAAAGPMTKRQKLDALLRELIQGKLSEKDYNARREQVLAEPD